MDSQLPQPDWAGVKTQELIDGRYRMVRKIGSGGMATVWLADDDRLDRRVAIKRLHTSAPADAAERLVREARLGAGLSDPHLVTVYDALATEDGVLIVMELVEGSDLDRELASGALDDERSVGILRSVAQALDHAHERGVVHRDIKPSNVLLGPGEVVKVADLGIAKALEETGLTQSGTILGSVPYMSPEQLLGEPIGPESDIYSLALIAYECLSGVRARAETGPVQAAHRVTNEPPPDISLERPGTFPGVVAVLTQALDREPGRRPGSAGAFVRDLADALRDEDRTSTPLAATAPLAESASSRGAPTPSRKAATASPVTTYGGRSGRRGRAGALAAIAAMVALVAVVAATQLGGGGSESPGNDRAANSAGKTASAAGGSGDSAGEQDAGGAAAPSPASESDAVVASSGGEAASDDPEKAVEDFYMLAAAHDTRAAWRIAAPSFRTQLEGYSTFTAQQSTLRRMKFRSLETTSQASDAATVSFATTATHTDHVDLCEGTAALVSDGARWQISQLTSVECTPG